MTNTMTESWWQAAVNAVVRAAVAGTRQHVTRVGGLPLRSAQVRLGPLKPHEDRLDPYGPPYGGVGGTGMCGHGGASLQVADGLGAGYGVEHDSRITERPPVIAASRRRRMPTLRSPS